MIAFEPIVNAAEQLCIGCGYDLPEDVFATLQNACQKESDEGARVILGQHLLMRYRQVWLPAMSEDC
jgi:tartrate dehydratase alpha subunit/fumarate hydratase class I-like protein